MELARFVRRARICAIFVATLGASMGAIYAAAAAPAIDCPLRDAPYSIDSPLIDVLLSPEAKSAVEHAAPTLLQRLPAMMTSTTPPSFAAIMTLRTMGAFARMPESALLPINEALSKLPVTDADREARCARYDVERPQIEMPKGKPRLLLFTKINGCRDGPSVEAANDALHAMAQRKGWALVATDKGGAITPAILEKFDAVIWNNVSGDVLTLVQRRALISKAAAASSDSTALRATRFISGTGMSIRCSVRDSSVIPWHRSSKMRRSSLTIGKARSLASSRRAGP